ncbi:MAG TPA: Snf7 family protein [Conexivisphaerales archaeon]|nr:Snf7 family protein [Conexivisphaerales archaeon]
MAEFGRKWKESDEPGIRNRVAGWFRPSEPLRPKIESAGRGLQSYIALLDSSSRKLRDRDSAIFAKVVRFVQERDAQHAAVYANELVELRRLEKLISSVQLAFEGILQRMRTATDLGDIVTILAPAEVILKSVRPGLQGVLPEAEREISEVGDLLSGVLTDAGTVGEVSVNFQAANEDAERILREAEVMAEEKMKERLPEVPSFRYAEEEGYGQ